MSVFLVCERMRETHQGKQTTLYKPRGEDGVSHLTELAHKH